MRTQIAALRHAHHGVIFAFVQDFAAHLFDRVGEIADHIQTTGCVLTFGQLVANIEVLAFDNNFFVLELELVGFKLG